MSKIVLENFNEGNGYYKVNLAYLSKEQVEEIEELVSKWKPSDEDIKSCIGMCLTDANEQRFKNYGTNLKDCLAWLEKQGELVNSLSKGLDNAHERIDGLIQKNNSLIEQLEKQGEQKPADKVEPKFKVGDWCIDNEDGVIFQIVKVLDNIYTYRTNEGKEYSCTYYSLENNSHIWTIKDAKDGDVLQLDEVTTIFQKYIGNGNCRCYCYVYNGEFEIPSQDSADNSYGCINAIPATKEQHDTLMKSMTDAGYTFDFEKKELKKIDDSVEKAIHKAGYEWSEDTHQLKKIDYNANECEWSTDDEQYLLVCKNALAKYQTTNHWDANIISQWLDNKLKSIITEQKSAWSEEDYKMLTNIGEYLNRYCNYIVESNKEKAGDVYKSADWLKSLKDRYTWKPSKEQIIALRWVLNNIPYSKYKEEIYGLLDQIKEL